MAEQKFTQSGTFVLILFLATAIGLPFGIEQIGESTGWFKFPVWNTVKGWFSDSSAQKQGQMSAKSVDWTRYRDDMEKFTHWADEQPTVKISQPPRQVEEIVVQQEKKVERKIWSVPVSSCTAGDVSTGRVGYIFITGLDRALREGARITPTEGLCGYEVVSIGERTVWFRIITEDDDDTSIGSIKFPEFTRIVNGTLIRGHRQYVVHDAFPLASGGWLMIDSILPPCGVVFKILDEKRQVVASFLCVVIDEKGGR